APGVAYWLSMPVGPRERPLSDADRQLLRRTARKTWRSYETFVTEADGWLPPDNYQEGEAPRLARRTSPTNVAMALLSTIAADGLGYITTAALVRRLDRTLTTLEGLEKHEGHLLNWYDTATFASLHPRYVSTVDSGNLAASLIAIAEGLFALTTKSQPRTVLLEGLVDAADLLALASASSPAPDQPTRDAVTQISRIAREVVSDVQRELSGGSPAALSNVGRELGEALSSAPDYEAARSAFDEIAF